jgi:hypothetical protein
MPDEIIKELWEIKDSIARQHGYDIETLVAHLQGRKTPEGGRIEDLRAMRKSTPQGAPPDTPKRGP